MQEQSTRFMAMFLKIDHYHNGLNEKKFTAESFCRTIFPLPGFCTTHNRKDK